VTTGPRQSGDGTVAKALTVLDAVAEHGRPVRFSDLLEDSPYPKATLYRFVQTLTTQGMLSFDPNARPTRPGCGSSGWPTRRGRPRPWPQSRGPISTISAAPRGKPCTSRSSMADRSCM
jgi:hypothetical protein